METSKKIIIVWLSSVLLAIVAQVILGGYVRLTDSGLSMYDWNVVTGIVSPLTEDAWQETFDNYKQTPEYKKINVGMTLHEYKVIYFREYNHRILGRATGLIFMLPLLFFLIMGHFKWRESKMYLTIGLLYAGQGLMGWYMVKSGLIDHPDVSHFRLAGHFLLALLIFSMVLWKLLDTVLGQKTLTRKHSLGVSFRFVACFLFLLVFQMMYGVFVAGLKAGFVSDTFPRMFGYLFPPNLFTDHFPGLMDVFLNTVTIHFIHRWFAFVVLIFSVYVYAKIRKKISYSIVLPLAVLLQIFLGLAVIWFHVPISIALIHQLGSIVILSVTVFAMHNCVRLGPKP